MITLFSASRYCGTQVNKGAFLTLDITCQPEIQQFYGAPTFEAVRWELHMDHREEENHRNEKQNDIDLENQITAAVEEDTHTHRQQRIIQDEMMAMLEGDVLRMVAERICDHKADLFWYFTSHEQERDGKVPRLVWADALKSVLKLELPFLLYQSKLADLEDTHKNAADRGGGGRRNHDNLKEEQPPPPLGLPPTELESQPSIAHTWINYSKFLSRYRIENPIVDASGWQESIISTICKKLYRALGAGSMEEVSIDRLIYVYVYSVLLIP